MSKNRVALVTGASSGIGKEIAKTFAKEGITVIINYSKSEKKANEVKSEIIKDGGSAQTFKADISKESEVDKMIDYISTEIGNLDILVNNAATDVPKAIEEMSYDEWKSVIDVNLNGYFLCTKKSINLLKKSKSGRIVNIGSRFLTKPLEEASAYCASKAGMMMLTKSTALELAKYKITVNTISPGLTRTGLTENILTKEEFESYAEKNPCKRIGKCSDIANMASFIISDKAEFITGENLNVSGGILLR